MFTDVLSNLDKVEQDILGPDYEYWKQIKVQVAWECLPVAITLAPILMD